MNIIYLKNVGICESARVMRPGWSAALIRAARVMALASGHSSYVPALKPPEISFDLEDFAHQLN
jgi:hypothetical protein